MPTRCPPFSHVPTQPSSPPQKPEKPSPTPTLQNPETRIFGKICVFPGPGQLTRTRNPEPGTRSSHPVRSGTRKPRFWNAYATKPNGTVELLLTMTVVEENPAPGELTRVIDPATGSQKKSENLSKTIDPVNRPGQLGAEVIHSFIHSLLTMCGFCCIIDLVTIRQVPN